MEVATAVLFVVVAVLYLVWRSNIGVRSLVPPSLLMLMSVRELDGDKWFTEKSVLSTGYYFDNPGVPYGERIVVGLVALAIAFVVLRFLWLARTQILTSLRAFQPFCRSIITGIVLLVASPFLDGLGRTFEMFGAQLGVTARATAIIVEETAELGIALAFLVALLQLRFDPAHNALPRGPESPRAADPRGPVGPRPAKGRATQNSRA